MAYNQIKRVCLFLDNLNITLIESLHPLEQQITIIIIIHPLLVLLSAPMQINIKRLA